MFMLDSMCFDQCAQVHAPQAAHTPTRSRCCRAVIPGIIKELTGMTRCPIIAGGLIRDKNEAIKA